MSKIQVPDHVAKLIEADLKKEKQTRVETPTEDGGPQPTKHTPVSYTHLTLPTNREV